MYKTSEWVVDEIKHANSINKEIVVEVKEEGVDYTNKIHDERQHIPLNPEDHMKCLVGDREGHRAMARYELEAKPRLRGRSPINSFH